MSRDEQIEEMAKHCHFYEEGKCLLLEDEAEECDARCDMCEFAKRLYNAGYRKSTDLAEEIFAEIENNADLLYDGYRDIVVITEKDFAELKKKYIGKDTNVTTKESEKNDGKI